MPHPFVDLLADRKIRLLWLGQALSALGTQLASIALIWLAIEISVGGAALLTIVGNAVLLAVSFLSGAFVDRFRPRTVMIAFNIAAAFFAALPVGLSLFHPIGLAGLVASVVGLSACSALFQPALQASVPGLAGTKVRIQGLNGLLDATYRLSRLVGSFGAGVLSLFLPPIHFLTANALTFLASAASVSSLSTPVAVSPPKPASVWRRLMMGIDATIRHRDVRRILLANTLVLMAWTPGLTLGVPLLVSETGLSGLGFSGLAVVALLMGAYGAGDLLSNVLVAAHRPKRIGPFMFGGYMILGGALAAVPLLMVTIPGALRLPAMMAALLVAGAGGPMFFLPMMTYIQTHMEPARLASVLRLRFTLIAAAMMAGAALVPPAVDHVGIAATMMICGAFIALVGLAGTIICRDLGQA